MTNFGRWFATHWAALCGRIFYGRHRSSMGGRMLHPLKWFAVCALMSSSLALADEPVKKIPPPDSNAVQAAMSLVDEAYKSDLNAAVTPQQKAAVVSKLLDAAKDEMDVASHFSLLVKARDYAITGGDFAGAASAIDAMDANFVVDALKMDADTAIAIAKTARSPEQRANLAKGAIDAAAKAVIADRYAIAQPLADIAIGSARLSDSPSLVRQATANIQQVREAEAAYTAVKPVLLVLAEKPADPEANLKVGKFRCFIKGDWEGGLPMLALGSDPALRGLAEKEVAGAVESDAQVALGDGWWIVAEKEGGAAKSRVQMQAARWYRMADPTLTGLTKARVDARLKTLVMVELAAPVNGRTINLLRMAEVKKDSVNGTWTFGNGALACDAAYTARFEFPYQPPAEYDYRVVFTRATGTGPLAMMCSAMGHRFNLIMATNKIWLGEIAGNNPTAHEAPGLIVNGHRQVAIVKIRKDGVQVYLDGKLITEFKTDYHDMSAHFEWTLPGQSTIGVGAYQSPTVFYDAEVMEITGKGRDLRQAPNK
jgi:hypothetical protein